MILRVINEYLISFEIPPTLVVIDEVYTWCTEMILDAI